MSNIDFSESLGCISFNKVSITKLNLQMLPKFFFKHFNPSKRYLESLCCRKSWKPINLAYNKLIFFAKRQRQAEICASRIQTAVFLPVNEPSMAISSNAEPILETLWNEKPRKYKAFFFAGKIASALLQSYLLHFFHQGVTGYFYTCKKLLFPQFLTFGPCKEKLTGGSCQ